MLPVRKHLFQNYTWHERVLHCPMCEYRPCTVESHALPWQPCCVGTLDACQWSLHRYCKSSCTFQTGSGGQSGLPERRLLDASVNSTCPCIGSSPIRTIPSNMKLVTQSVPRHVEVTTNLLLLVRRVHVNMDLEAVAGRLWLGAGAVDSCKNLTLRG